MYHYDEFDAAFVAARVEQFRDQVARRLSGELTEEQFRPHRLMNGLYLQLHAYMLRIAIPYGVAELAPVAQARRHRAHATTAATAISRRGRTSSSTGRRSRICPTFWPSSRASRCMRSRPREIASATSPPTISPAPRPTKSPIRALMPKSCGNGRRCIPNSRSCRASSRSRSTAPPQDRAVDPGA